MKPGDAPVSHLDGLIMAAFGLKKLPFFSSRRADDDGDARFEESSPKTKKSGKKGLPLLGKGEQLPELAPPVVGKREKQIDGQAIRRPISGAAALEGGFLSLAGIREHYMAEEQDEGRFVIRHIESGKDVTISGIDYIQFADLTVSCAFLTRSNPENLVLPAPVQAAGTQGNIHDITKEVATAIDEGLLAGADKDPAVQSAPQETAQESEPPAMPEAARAAAPEEEQETGDDRPESDAPGAITITEAELLAGAGDEAAGSLRIVKMSCRQDGQIHDNGDGSWTFYPAGAFDGEVALDLTIRDADGEESSVEAILTIEADDDQDQDTEHQDPTVQDAKHQDIADQDAVDQDTVDQDRAALETLKQYIAPTTDDHPATAAQAQDDEAQAVTTETIIAAPMNSEPENPVAETEVVETEVVETEVGGPEVGGPEVAETTAPESEARQNTSEPAPEQPAAGPVEDLIVKVSELIGEDFEGQNVRLHGFTQPDNGRLVDNGDGTLSFTPDAGWDGSTTFTYSVIDEAEKVTSCTLIVELDPDDAPQSQAPAMPDPEGSTGDALSHGAAAVDATPRGDRTEAADLYAGARYEDIEVDEDDRPIGAHGPEMTALLQDPISRDPIAQAPRHEEDTAGADRQNDRAPSNSFLTGLKADSEDRALDSAAEGAKKTKKRSKNAEAAEALFKQLDW